MLALLKAALSPLVAFILCALLFSVPFAASFGFGAGMILTHVVVVADVIVLLVLFRGALGDIEGPVMALLLSLFGVMLAVLYEASIAARVAWFDKTSAAILLEYARILPVIIRDTSPLPVALSYALVLIAPAVAGILSWMLGHSLDRRAPRTAHSKTKATALLIAALVVSGVGFRTVKDMRIRSGEPITSLFPHVDIISPIDFDEAVGIRLGPPIAANAPPARRRNIILIVVDDLRADHLSMYGYERQTMPRLAARLDSSTVLRSEWATSTCSLSVCGIAAIMYSKDWSNLDVASPSLADVARDAGYSRHVIVSGDFSFGFGGLGVFVGREGAQIEDGFGAKRESPFDDRTILDVLDSLDASDASPSFFYFHAHSVHLIGTRFLEPEWTPYRYDQHGTKSFAAQIWRHFLKDYGKGTLMVEREPAVNHYDNGILQADYIVSGILSRLGDKGYLDDAIVVVTSDHGEPLGEHGDFLHGATLYGESINVPLFIIDPRLGHGEPVPYSRQIDIAPTVAALAGLSIPPEWDGISLLDSIPRQSFHTTIRTKPAQAVIVRDSLRTLKYLFDRSDGMEELYELRSDPGEWDNLANLPEWAHDLERLRKLLESRFGSLP